MRQAIFIYPCLLLFLFITTSWGPNVLLLLLQPITSVVSKHRKGHTLLRQNNLSINISEEHDTTALTARRNLLSTKFQSDYPPISVKPTQQHTTTMSHGKHFLSARVDNNNNETCSASC